MKGESKEEARDAEDKTPSLMHSRDLLALKYALYADRFPQERPVKASCQPTGKESAFAWQQSRLSFF